VEVTDAVGALEVPCCYLGDGTHASGYTVGGGSRSVRLDRRQIIGYEVPRRLAVSDSTARHDSVDPGDYVLRCLVYHVSLEWGEAKGVHLGLPLLVLLSLCNQST